MEVIRDAEKSAEIKDELKVQNTATMKLYKEQDYMKAIDWSIITAYDELKRPSLNSPENQENVKKRAFDLIQRYCKFEIQLDTPQCSYQNNPDMFTTEEEWKVEEVQGKDHWVRVKVQTYPYTSKGVQYAKCKTTETLLSIGPDERKTADHLTDEDKQNTWPWPKTKSPVKKDTTTVAEGRDNLIALGYLIKEEKSSVQVGIRDILGTARGTRTTWDVFKNVADLSCIRQHLQLHHMPDENRFIRAAMKLFPNIEAAHVGASLTVLRRCIENIYANLGHPHATLQQTIFYQYSLVGGTGKSLFLDRLQHFADKYHITANPVQAPGKWASEEYATNIIGICSEYLPPSKYAKETVGVVLNDIVDNTFYKVEHKGVDAHNVQSHVTLFVGSNSKPWDYNDRRWGVIPYNEINLSAGIPECYREYLLPPEEETYFYDKTEYKQKRDYWDYWDEVFRELFESCPFGKTWTDKEVFISDYTEKLLHAVEVTLGVVSDVSNPADIKFNPESATIIQFVKAYNNLVLKNVTGFGYDGNIYNTTKKWITAAAITSNQKGLLECTRSSGNGKQYCYYNWAKFVAEHTDEVDDTEATDDVPVSDNLMEVTRKAFESFLVPEKAPGKTVTKLSDGWVFVPTNGHPQQDAEHLSTVNNGQEYVHINKLIEDAPMDGKDEHYHNQNFLLEMDDLPLTKQQALMEIFMDKYRDCVLWYCFSGGKSMHMVIRTNLRDYDATPDLRKFILEKLSSTYFEGHIDMQNVNAGRIGRNPGAVRHWSKNADKSPVYDEKGVVQEVMFVNEDTKEFDVIGWVNEYKYEQDRKQADSKYRPVFTGKNSRPPIEQLKAMTNAANCNDKLVLAYQALTTDEAPSSGDSFGAVMALMKLAKYNEAFEELSKDLFKLCKEQHPSNLPKDYDYYFARTR